MFGKLFIIPLNLYKPHTEELVSKFSHIKMHLMTLIIVLENDE
jgi:hypothetical protein